MRKNVALGLVPSLGGERPAHMAIPHPSDLRVLDIQHRYSGEGRNPEGWGEGIVALGLVARPVRAASSPALHRPASHHFQPLMRPSQGHRDSGKSRNPERGGVRGL